MVKFGNYSISCARQVKYTWRFLRNLKLLPMENLRNQHTEDIADLYFDFDRRNAFCCIAYFTNRLTASVWVNYKDTPEQALEAGALYFKESFKLFIIERIDVMPKGINQLGPVPALVANLLTLNT